VLAVVHTGLSAGAGDPVSLAIATCSQLTRRTLLQATHSLQHPGITSCATTNPIKHCINGNHAQLRLPAAAANMLTVRAGCALKERAS
jgi:hypothetical protein